MPKIVDRVKQACDESFEGTINIRLVFTNDGLNGFTKFSDAISLGTEVFYVVESTDTSLDEWECGHGTYNHETISGNTRKTITRTAGNVYAGSSGPGTLVDFSAGDKVVYISALSVTLDGLVKNNFTLGAAPEATNDSSEGYQIGSKVADSSGAIYTCVDATVGDAVWERIITITDLSDVYIPNVTLDISGAGISSNVTKFSHTGVVIDAFEGDNTNRAHIGGTCHIVTTDATPTELASGDTDPITISLADISSSCSFVVEATIVAASSSDQKSWKVTCGGGRTSDPTITLGTATVTNLYASAGASTWDVDIITDDVDSISFEATGEAGTGIYWFARFDVTMIYKPSF